MNALSGRRDRPDMTRAATQAILRHLEFEEGQRVLDIGCGDANLLRAIPVAISAVGTVLTEEERQRLAAVPELSAIQFYAASFDDIRLIPGSFDRIIINGSLHFAFTRANAFRILKDIAAKLTPNGQLWLGELLAKKQAQPRVFVSRTDAIRYVYENYGVCFALRFLAHIIRRRARANCIIELPSRLFYVKPHEIYEIAAFLNMRIVGIWECAEITGESFFLENERFSALLSKN
jgi:SAM-dependent methyltransferase